MISFSRLWSNGSCKTHVTKVQGSDSKVFGTARDPNPVAIRGRANWSVVMLVFTVTVKLAIK